MNVRSIAKRVATAAIAAAALTGPVTAAHALQFGSGDAVLVLYGNNTEYVQNLGNFQTLLSTGTTLNLSSIMASVGGTNTIKYTIVGNDAGVDFFFGDGSALSTWTSLQKSQVVPTNYNTGLTNWSGNLKAVNDTRSLIPATDALSFSTNIDPVGSGSLGGSVPSTKPAFSNIDSTLYLLSRGNTAAAGTLAQVGTAVLNSATGIFTIGPVAAVPVPAAAVLFATGVIGLVGLGRRRALGLQ